MKSARALALAIAALATVAACKKAAPPAEPEPAVSSAPVPVAAPVPAPEPSASAPIAAGNPEEDISIPEDFEGEVTKAITDKNYKAELDKVEKEIASTPE